MPAPRATNIAGRRREKWDARQRIPTGEERGDSWKAFTTVNWCIVTMNRAFPPPACPIKRDRVPRGLVLQPFPPASGKLAKGAGDPFRHGRAAFTLTEVLIASSIFLLVVGAIIATNFFGGRMLQLVQPMLRANDEARQMLQQITSDIRSAKSVSIGAGSFTTFTNIVGGAPRQGNAIQIYPTTDTNIFIRYYRDTAAQNLKRMTNGGTSATVVANAITNSVVFRAEDAFGNVLTNSQNNMVIFINLEYFELEGSGLPLGPANYFKSYQLQTRAAHRPR